MALLAAASIQVASAPSYDGMPTRKGAKKGKGQRKANRTTRWH